MPEAYPLAPDFTLSDHNGGQVTLSKALGNGPAMLVFYPGDFMPVCARQLCDYRDRISQFQEFGVQVFGINDEPSPQHQQFAQDNQFPFLLLSDPRNKVARDYGCRSLFMLGRVSRAVVIVSRRGHILYKHVEPTTLTRRSSGELVKILRDLEDKRLL